MNRTEKIWRVFKIGIIAVPIIALVCIKVSGALEERDSPKAVGHAQVLSCFTPDINDTILLDMMKQLKIEDPELMVILAKVESGNYKSRVCVENHNLFGMKYYPESRRTTAIKDSNGYAYYESYLESVIDLKLYFAKYGNHLVGYSANPDYKNWLKSKVNK